MMNRIALFLSVTCLMMLVGCAAPMAAQPAAVRPMPVMGQQGPMPMGPAYGQQGDVGIPPRPMPPVAGPPQNWAWLNQPPFGCAAGPLAMKIENTTKDKFVELSLDGEPLVIRGAYGVLPQLPPKGIVYLCLASQGVHTLRGIVYVNRMGVLQKDQSDRNKFSSEITVNNGYYFRVTDNLLFYGYGDGVY